MIFAALAAEGKAYDAALKAADDATLKSDHKFRSYGFQVFAALVARGEAYHEGAALELRQALQGEKYTVSSYVLLVLEALAAQGKAGDTALRAACFSLRKLRPRSSVLNSFKILGALAKSGLQYVEDGIRAVRELALGLHPPYLEISSRGLREC